MAHVRSYRVSTSTTLELPRPLQPVTIPGEGAFDPQRHVGRMSLDLSSLSPIVGRPTGTATLVLAGHDVYMRIPFLSALQPGLKPWLKIDLQEAGRSQGVDFSTFLQFGQGGDPTQTLQYLRAAGDVKKVGEEDVRGVATTHYHAIVDLDKAIDKASKDARDALKSLVDELGKHSLPIDVWIDGKGLVRKTTYEQSLSDGSHARFSAVVTRFGPTVPIEPPPSDEVVDIFDVALGG
jgi:hypothetical protein